MTQHVSILWCLKDILIGKYWGELRLKRPSVGLGDPSASYHRRKQIKQAQRASEPWCTGTVRKQRWKGWISTGWGKAEHKWQAEGRPGRCEAQSWEWNNGSPSNRPPSSTAARRHWARSEISSIACKEAQIEKGVQQSNPAQLQKLRKLPCYPSYPITQGAIYAPIAWNAMFQFCDELRKTRHICGYTLISGNRYSARFWLHFSVGNETWITHCSWGSRQCFCFQKYFFFVCILWSRKYIF